MAVLEDMGGLFGGGTSLQGMMTPLLVLMYVVIYGGLIAVVVWFIVKWRRHRTIVYIYKQIGDKLVKVKPDRGWKYKNDIKLWWLRRDMPLFNQDYFGSDYKGREFIEVVWDGKERFVPLSRPKIDINNQALYPSYSYDDREWLRGKFDEAEKRHFLKNPLLQNLPILLNFGLVIAVVVLLIFVAKEFTEMSNAAASATLKAQESLDHIADVMERFGMEIKDEQTQQIDEAGGG